MNKFNACTEKWNKYFKLDKQYFEEFIAFSSTKLKYTWFKKLLLGFFGGLFIGLGYTAYLLIAGANSAIDPMWLKLIGALTFPIALLLCLYFGGSLFTSNCMCIISVWYKEHIIKHYVLDLTLIIIGNALGTFIFALIAWGSNFFGAIGDNSINHAGSFVINNMISKIDSSHQWWNNFLSGILCNFIVVATTIVSILTKRNGIGVFLIYLMLVIFVITGSQHIVANFYLFSLGGFLSIHETATHLTSLQIGELFYQNLIPTLLGNWLGGIGLTFLFLSGQSFVYKRKQKNQNNAVEIKIADSNDK